MHYFFHKDNMLLVLKNIRTSIIGKIVIIATINSFVESSPLDAYTIDGKNGKYKDTKAPSIKNNLFLVFIKIPPVI